MCLAMQLVSSPLVELGIVANPVVAYAGFMNFDDVDVGDVLQIEESLHDHFLSNDKLSDLLLTIQKNQKLDEVVESSLEDGIKEFKKLMGN